MRSRALLLALAACTHAAPSATTPAQPHAAAATPAPTPAAPLPAWSEATFAANAHAELERRFPGAAIAPTDDPDVLRVEVKGGDKMEINFAKPHAQCREDWSRCAAAVDHTLTALAEVAHPPATTPAQLRVVLRTVGKLARYEGRAKVTARPFSPDTEWVLAADSPDAVRLSVDPQEVGMSEDAAWQRAVANVKPSHPVTQVAHGFIFYIDDYAPSALQYPDLMLAAARAAFPGSTGHLIAATPEENVVIYTIGGTSEAVELHAGALAGLQRSQTPLSAQVMEWTGTEWHESR